MATAVLLPKLGNSVESSLIVRWIKRPGEPVAAGEPLCEIETDKATVEVNSPAAGVLLEAFFGVGDDVPVLTAIAAIGAPGEDPAPFRPANAMPVAAATPANAAPVGLLRGVSPRARRLAEREGLSAEALAGSGPGGRVIERDVHAALKLQPRMTPLARAMVERGGFVPPEIAGRRITSRDLHPPAGPPAIEQGMPPSAEEVETIPLSGVRRVIAERMLASLQTTAQLTLHSLADARRLREYRARLKSSPEALGLQGVTINDLMLFVVSRTLPDHPELNALFADGAIARYRHVHLGVAVDTPRGLLVPVVRRAETLSLRELANAAGRLATAAREGRAMPDDLSGGTFTVTNLGGFGIDRFTPILNPPQVAILGIGAIEPRPVEGDDGIAFVPHVNLSLTINHQVVDGAPAARFLQALARNIADLDVLLAR